MSAGRRIVLDANILVRAVFGNKVGAQLQRYVGEISFHTPESCFAEAAKSIPAIAARRNFDLAYSYRQLDDFARLVEQVDENDYGRFETRALARISPRDPSDWPIIATALFLDCPIWTEDRDFFGTGVATWTSDRVEIYLRGE